MKKNSGVYFGSYEKEIRIGCSIDVWDRTKNHQSSNNRYKVVGFIPTDKKEIFDEENKAFNYFQDYKIRNSFYDISILAKIQHSILYPHFPKPPA